MKSINKRRAYDVRMCCAKQSKQQMHTMCRDTNFFFPISEYGEKSEFCMQLLLYSRNLMPSQFQQKWNGNRGRFRM